MRKIISIIFGILLLGGAILLSKYFIDNRNKPKPKFEKIVKTVFVDKVLNKEIPIVITTSGNLNAKNKIELFAEVQGVLNPSSKEFKAGTYYAKGESILHINSEEFTTS